MRFYIIFVLILVCKQGYSQVNYPYLDLKGSEYLDFLDGDEIVMGVDNNGREIRYLLFIEDGQIIIQGFDVNGDRVRYARPFTSIEEATRNLLNQPPGYGVSNPGTPQVMGYKTMTRGQYIAGGVVETLLAGLGIGHFIQGRNLSGSLILVGGIVFIGLAAGVDTGFVIGYVAVALAGLITAWAPGDDWIVVDLAPPVYFPRDLQSDMGINNLNKNYNRIDVGIKIPFH